MSAAMHPTFRLLPGEGRRRARTTTDWLVSGFVVLAIVAVLVAVVSGLSEERRAIRALPDERRLAVLSRTVDELKQFCGGSRPEALRAHCHELASFASQFDECRGECEALVRRELAAAPTR
jgi:hypothetical protein